MSEKNKLELVKKYKLHERPLGNDPKKVFSELKNLFNTSKEYFIVLHLDTKHKIICREIVHIGGLNQALIEPRAIFKNAISLDANSIILAHNHSSGDLEPSKEDKEITLKLLECGDLLGIKVLDHIIFNDIEYKSRWYE